MPEQLQRIVQIFDAECDDQDSQNQDSSNLAAPNLLKINRVFRMVQPPSHPGGNPGANLKVISHRCYARELAFEWELTNETIHLPLGCLQGGFQLACPLIKT